jgi:cytochrome c peroxidase
VHGDEPVAGDALLAQAGKSLAAYQRQLATGPSAFDRWAAALRAGDAREVARYPIEAARGAALFFGKANCRSCHAGAEFTDEEFHDLGLPPVKGAKRDEGRREGLRQLLADRFRADSQHSDARDGERARELAHLAPVDEDWGRFKTPSLRNATRTAPYMHTGQFATLRDVVRFYSTLDGAAARGHHGETVLQPLNLSDAEIDDLVAFLGTLEGELPPEHLLRAP